MERKLRECYCTDCTRFRSYTQHCKKFNVSRLWYESACGDIELKNILKPATEYIVIGRRPLITKEIERYIIHTHKILQTFK